MFENQVFNDSSICFRHHKNQSNKQSKLTKSFLGLVLNLQKTAYLQYVSRTNQEPTLTTNSQKLKLH